MAITSEITVTINAANLPSNYTPTPPGNTFVSPTILNIIRDEPIALIPDADGAVGVANLTTALLAWLDTTYYLNTLKLDPTQSILATASLKQAIRTNDTLIQMKDQYFPGVEVYRCSIEIKWE